MKKLWCSQHQPVGQGEDFEFLSCVCGELQRNINSTGSDPAELKALATKLVRVAAAGGYDIYQPGGSPAFQFVLGGIASTFQDVSVHYSHSQRVSKEVLQADGSVLKTSVFKHICWIRL